MKIVVFASLASSLINFRGKLLAAMVEHGHDVVACAPEAGGRVGEQLAEMGVEYRRVPMDRTGLSPAADLRTLAAMTRLLRAERPDVVLAYTQKPIIYGGIAARMAGVPNFHAMCSGLGHAFSEDASNGLRRLVAGLYRVAVSRAASVIVFNSDDADEMRRHGIVDDRHRVVQVPGSGIDIARFKPVERAGRPPVILLIARLLHNKGIADFVRAARLVRNHHGAARFQLLGPLDPNPSGITPQELEAWVAEGLVEYLGETDDVRPFLDAATTFVLPTWYREGLPRTILEAMASGLPVITTDTPGCRDAVRDGVNGLLVPVRDADALGAAMLRLATDPGEAAAMGRTSRRLAESRYDVDLVNAQLLRTMGLDRPAPVAAPHQAAHFAGSLR